MDKGYGLLLQMIRTGEGLVWEHVEPIIQHQIDVDTVHDAENEHWIGAQRYHFAKHGATRDPTLCHEWIDGPLFFALLSGYKRAEEVALSRAEHFVQSIERREHRVKTLTRVAGYPWRLLQETADRDFDVMGLIRPEGFTTKGTSPFRNYYEPEPDFWFEPMMLLTLKSGQRRYADVGFAELQRIFAQRKMLAGETQNLPPHFYRYWLPALARADELGVLIDPQPL